MSSVGVVTQKKSKCFVRKKNLSVRRKIFKVWRGREKKCKCRISGVRKKKEIERKVLEKKSKCFWVEIKVKVAILLEKGKVKENVRVVDIPLVGRYVTLQVRITIA
jgi:hypothetical protein